MTAATALSVVWRRALDIVFPPRCVGCGAFGAFICPDCLGAIPRALPPRCPMCWMPGAQGVCGRCLDRPFAFQAARSPFVYEAAARDAVYALKYHGLSAVAEAMAVPMAERLSQWDHPVAALVPVPLAGRRRRSRGYNQSELLAKELARLTDLSVVAGALSRTRSAPPQARAADEAARRASVAGAFTARPGLVDGPVLLIDDVMTSGATLDACARALRDAGYGPILALTFARED